MVCEEWSQHAGRPDPLATPVDAKGRPIAEVLRSIASHYIAGTPNGIRMDPASGLVFSPTHFTWMDTNFPAATPREGYPVEIQVLWIRLLRQLARFDRPLAARWQELATRSTASFERSAVTANALILAAGFVLMEYQLAGYFLGAKA